MIIEQYNIRLRRITIDDIEVIRVWRNDPSVRKHMAYKKYITQRMQQKWFASVNNPYNYYFMINYEGEDIGVINCKNVNIKDGYGEGGIFIFNQKHIESMAPVFASLCLINAIFYVMKFSNKSFIRIMRNNSRAIKYNRSMGYTLIPGQDEIKNQWYVLTKEDYEIKSSKLNKAAAIITKDTEQPRVFGKPMGNNLDEINKLLIQK